MSYHVVPWHDVMWDDIIRHDMTYHVIILHSFIPNKLADHMPTQSWNAFLNSPSLLFLCFSNLPLLISFISSISLRLDECMLCNNDITHIYPHLPPPSLLLTHTHTHRHTHKHTHRHTHKHTRTLTHTHSLSHTHTHSYSPTHSPTHSGCRSTKDWVSLRGDSTAHSRIYESPPVYLTRKSNREV